MKEDKYTRYDTTEGEKKITDLNLINIKIESNRNVTEKSPGPACNYRIFKRKIVKEIDTVLSKKMLS